MCKSMSVQTVKRRQLSQERMFLPTLAYSLLFIMLILYQQLKVHSFLWHGAYTTQEHCNLSCRICASSWISA